MRSISICEADLTCTVTEDPAHDLTIYGYVDLIKQCLVGVGFHPENVDDLFADEERWTQRSDSNKRN